MQEEGAATENDNHWWDFEQEELGKTEQHSRRCLKEQKSHQPMHGKEASLDRHVINRQCNRIADHQKRRRILRKNPFSQRAFEDEQPKIEPDQLLEDRRNGSSFFGRFS